MKSMKVVLAALFGLSFSWNVCAQQSDIKDQGYVHKSSTSYEYPTDPAVLQKLDQDRKSTRLNSSHKHRSRMPSSA